jgi:hypothetical protein
MCQRRKSTVNYPRCCFSTTNSSNPGLWRCLIHHVTGYPSVRIVAIAIAAATTATTVVIVVVVVVVLLPNYYKWNCPFELRETNGNDARRCFCTDVLIISSALLQPFCTRKYIYKKHKFVWFYYKLPCIKPSSFVRSTAEIVVKRTRCAPHENQMQPLPTTSSSERRCNTCGKRFRNEVEKNNLSK